MKKHLSFPLPVLVLLMAGCSAAPKKQVESLRTPAALAPSARNPSSDADENAQFLRDCENLRNQKNISADEKLTRLFDLSWEHELVSSPERATYHGDPRGQDRLSDISHERIQRQNADNHCLLETINSVLPSDLKTDADRLNRELFKLNLVESIDSERFPDEVLRIDTMGGPHTSITGLLLAMRKNSVHDFDDRIARLKQVPRWLDQQTVFLKEGLAKGITPPRVTLKNIPAQVTPLLDRNFDKNPLSESFREMPASILITDRNRIMKDAEKVVADQVIPAFAAFQKFLASEYVPKSREPIAFTTVPDGKAWYEALIRMHTTTKLSAQEIHDIGMRETKRLDLEMSAAIQQTGWKKDRAAFFKFLRTDPRFFYRTREELLAGYRDIAKRIDPSLPEVFGKLPRLTFGIKAQPTQSEKKGPTAYYNPGSPESGRPGWFMANAYDLKSRPKWEMESLTLHETVPGHHLQIALAQEQDVLPKFRRGGGYTAYVEGWGLYAESLGRELGLYKDPYANIGRITLEMWRANRLVVDTGIHSLGWTRDQSINRVYDGAFAESSARHRSRSRSLHRHPGASAQLQVG